MLWFPHINTGGTPAASGRRVGEHRKPFAAPKSQQPGRPVQAGHASWASGTEASSLPPGFRGRPHQKDQGGRSFRRPRRGFSTLA